MELIAVQQGYRLEDVQNFSDVKKQSIRYMVALQNGFTVNWKDGSVSSLDTT